MDVQIIIVNFYNAASMPIASFYLILLRLLSFSLLLIYLFNFPHGLSRRLLSKIYGF